MFISNLIEKGKIAWLGGKVINIREGDTFGGLLFSPEKNHLYLYQNKIYKQT